MRKHNISLGLGWCNEMAIPEPSVIYPEAQFQKAVVKVIEDVLTAAGRDFIVLERFGLDIAVFVASQPNSVVRLLEVKAFGAQRMGGIGFGNNMGQGAQIDLLLCPDASLTMLDGSIRWIYADATKSVGSPRYALFSCAKAKTAAMGGVARGKQNNLRISALWDCLLDWTGLNSEVRRFLLS